MLLLDRTGTVRYAGWYRRLVETGRTMPDGNATVILRPSIDEHGHFRLSSKGAAFGDAGFYRVQAVGDGRLRVWRVSTLLEDFRVYVDDANILRCDHAVSFLGMPILHLHYRIERMRDVPAA